MIKYTIFLAAVFGSSVATYADLASEGASPMVIDPSRTTVIYKNEAWPIMEPLVIEYCGLEDCSDTPQNDAS